MNHSSVSPATSDNSPCGTGLSALLLASGASQWLERVPRSCTSTCWPTRTQYVFALPSIVINRTCPPGTALGQPNGAPGAGRTGAGGTVARGAGRLDRMAADGRVPAGYRLRRRHRHAAAVTAATRQVASPIDVRFIWASSRFSPSLRTRPGRASAQGQLGRSGTELGRPVGATWFRGLPAWTSHRKEMARQPRIHTYPNRSKLRGYSGWAFAATYVRAGTWAEQAGQPTKTEEAR